MEIRTYEREKLYKEVWAEPMTTVAKRYGISDVALRKQCKKLEIPLPKAGHWAKVKAGHKIKIPTLTKTKGPDKSVVILSTNHENKSLGTKMLDTLQFLPEERRQAVKEYCFSVTVPDKLTRPHDLVKDTKQYYRSRKESTKPPVNRVIKFNVSDEQEERVYRFYNTLFSAMEHLGYTVEIKAPKSERYYNYNPRVHDNETHICLGVDSVPVFIKEKYQRIEHKPTKEELKDKYAYIPRYDFINTGKLHFGIDEYHAKRKNWRDRETKIIEDQIGDIIIWVMEAIQIERIMREEREAERIRRQKEELIRQQKAEKRKNELEQLELLEQYAADLDKAQKIRMLADSVEMKVPILKVKKRKSY